MAYLAIINVTNPATPIVESYISTNLTSSGQGLFVSGRYAYVTNSTNPGNLAIFDISNPLSPVLVGNLTTNMNFPVAVYVQGRYAYVGNANGDEINVVDVSNPANPISTGVIGLNTGNANSVFALGRYLYVASSAYNQVVVFDLGGTYTQQLQVGGTETGTLQVDGNSNLAGDTSIAGGLSVANNTAIEGNLAVAGASNFGSVVTITGGAASTPGIPTVTPSPAGGSTSYSYEIAAINGNGQTTAASSAGSTTTGPATLTATTFNIISWTAVSGAFGYNIYRTADGQSGQSANVGLIGTSYGNSFNDIGYAASGSAPSTNSITTAFQVQTAAGTNVLSVDTTNTQVLIGTITTTSTSCGGTLGGNGVCLSASTIAYAGSARPTEQITLTAEYAGAVLDPTTGTNNVGTMTSGIDKTGSGGYTYVNYYNWTTGQATAQNYDIWVQVPVPKDFSAWSSTTPMTILDNSSVTTANSVSVAVYDTSGTQVTQTSGTMIDITPGSANTWTAKTPTSGNINFSSGTFAAGGTFQIDLRLAVTYQWKY